MEILQQIEKELSRLETGPIAKEKPTCVGIVNFLVRCPFEPYGVLSRVKSALSLVDYAIKAGWPGSDKQLSMPGWFTAACSPPMTDEQAKKWLDWWKTLPNSEKSRVELEKDWSLESWLYWMEPNNRQWYWWDAKVLGNHDHINLEVEVKCWPFPWGSLRWLFKAAGASSVESESG